MPRTRVKKSDDELTLPRETALDIVTESTTPEDTEAAKEAERQKPVLAKMRKQFKASVDMTSFFREQASEDTKFRAGTWGKKSYQWVENIQSEREANGQPCLTINKAPGFIRQVTNQAVNAHLRIKCSPVDDRGDVKTAEILQGIIRNIETTSFADRAYNKAAEKQAEIGLGAFRLITEWAENDPKDVQAAFRQRIKIKREKNPLSLYFGPCQEADFSDSPYAFKVTDLDKETAADVLGEAVDESAIAAFSATGDEGAGDWFPNGKVRIVEWFNREAKGPKRKLALLSNGRVLEYKDDAQLAEIEKLGDSVIQKRTTQKKVTVWRKCTATKIYEETTWPADSHPFMPVIGDELEIDGQLDFRGVVRDYKDPARVYNAETSALIEAVGRGQKAPVVGYRGQFGAVDSLMRKAWETANRKPVAFLEVEPMDIDGKPAPFPQPVRFDPDLGGVVLAIRQADEDCKTTAGYHDASLGERGPQESARAIVARQRQDELGSSHYLDNLRFALCAAGRQLIQLIRAVYDVPSVIRILGTAGQAKKVMVFSGAERDPRNAQFLQQGPEGPNGEPGQPIPFQLPEGVEGIYDLSVGEYDIEVSASHDEGSRRQEAVEAMTSLFKGLPPEMAMNFLDLYFIVMDFPKAQQMAERAKKMLPEQFQDDEDGTKPQIPPQVMKQMQQMKEQLGQAMQALQAAHEEIKTERYKVQSSLLLKREELDSRERIERLKIQAHLLEQKIEIRAEEALTLLQAEIDRITAATDHKRTKELAQIDAEIGRLTAQNDFQLETTAREGERGHEVGMSLLNAATAAASQPPDDTVEGETAE